MLKDAVMWSFSAALKSEWTSSFNN